MNPVLGGGDRAGAAGKGGRGVCMCACVNGPYRCDPEMSPFPVQSTWSKATWEIMESEHIDFLQQILAAALMKNYRGNAIT